MLQLILLLILGSVMAYLAQNNSTLVQVNLGTYMISDVPLFYVIIGSLVTGLGLAYLIYLISSIVMGFKMRRKDTKIKQSKDEIAELTKRVHQLELENVKLKNSSRVEEPSDPNAL